jgi:hypothetical protein
MFKRNKQPRTVDQITQNLQMMVDELSISEARYEEIHRQNKAEAEKLFTQNEDIATEINRNRKVALKLLTLFEGDK